MATPTGTVSFFVDGSATPAATVAVVNGQASFVADLGGGAHHVVTVYSGDADFLGSTATAATWTVGCTTTITGSHISVQAASGTTCILGAQITGSIVVSKGATLDIENTVSGAISSNGAAAVRICGTTTSGSVTETARPTSSSSAIPAMAARPTRSAAP